MTLKKCHAIQPIATIKKYIVLIPANAEREPGFFLSLLKVWNIGKNSGARMSFYANEKTNQILKSIIKKANIEAVFNTITTWEEGQQAAFSLEDDEGLIMLMAERGMESYFSQMQKVPEILNKNLSNNKLYPYLSFFKN
ncbi:hypothetical protein [Flavobacterium flavigenum]|uniref:hypothetical protein n=1 Tax=Flavobacterium flavigenum TaxID=3003258 RepID=UPI002482359F|nr:hypothetical protein [Flavobacterium flavigenum]